MNSIQYYSDPSFSVLRVPKWRAAFYKFLSVNVWGAIPSPFQKKMSKVYANLYNKPFSKHLIRPYVRFYYNDPNYLEKFKPPFEKEDFHSFQDFFIREFKELPDIDTPYVWSSEGLLCDVGRIRDIRTTSVKGEIRTPSTVFGLADGEIPKDHTFTNVFLHNKNYHRIHVPTSGTITRIQHIPGDLVVLRPWIYKQNPSIPAFRNERYNVDIKDEYGKTWYLSIVGGPAVGTIELAEDIEVGVTVDKLDQLALFYLGSTCCMAAPVAPRVHRLNSFVEVGAVY